MNLHSYIKAVMAAGCLALALPVSALTNSIPHIYPGNLKVAMRIGSDLYDSLDAKYQKTLEPIPITLVPLETPEMTPVESKDETKKLAQVSVSVGFITLINRIAHAKAIDRVQPGYFDQYVASLSQDSADENPPALPNIGNENYWTRDVMNDQGAFFNQMMGLTMAINLSHHYLGQYNKYSGQMSGRLVPINNFLTSAEWDRGVKAAAQNSLDCAFGTEGGKALFEAIGEMPRRPAWAAFILPQNVDIKRLNQRLAKYEVEFFHGR